MPIPAVPSTKGQWDRITTVLSDNSTLHQHNTQSGALHNPHWSGPTAQQGTTLFTSNGFPSFISPPWWLELAFKSIFCCTDLSLSQPKTAVTESDDGQQICAGPIKGCDESWIKVETEVFCCSVPKWCYCWHCCHRIVSVFLKHRKTCELLHSFSL